MSPLRVAENQPIYAIRIYCFSRASSARWAAGKYLAAHKSATCDKCAPCVRLMDGCRQNSCFISLGFVEIILSPSEHTIAATPNRPQFFSSFNSKLITKFDSGYLYTLSYTYWDDDDYSKCIDTLCRRVHRCASRGQRGVFGRLETNSRRRRFDVRIYTLHLHIVMDVWVAQLRDSLGFVWNGRIELLCILTNFWHSCGLDPAASFSIVICYIWLFDYGFDKKNRWYLVQPLNLRL